MSPAPLAGNADTREQAAPDTRAPAPVTIGHGRSKARALPRRAARRAQSALLAAARADIPGMAAAEPSSGRLRQIAGQLQPRRKTRGGHYDPVFLRPDLIEDDYYRLRHQPRG